MERGLSCFDSPEHYAEVISCADAIGQATRIWIVLTGGEFCGHVSKSAPKTETGTVAALTFDIVPERWGEGIAALITQVTHATARTASSNADRDRTVAVEQ